MFLILNFKNHIHVDISLKVFRKWCAGGGGGPCVLMYQTIEVQPGVYMNVYRSGHGHHQTTNKSTVSKNF